MQHVKTYCEESSIHGITQLVNQKSHWFEKIFWFFTIIISIICCGFLIAQIGGKLSEGSLITFISDTSVNCEDVIKRQDKYLNIVF